MQLYVGVLREEKTLAETRRFLSDLWQKPCSPALKNSLTAALMITHAAWARLESRGSHARTDYPALSAAYDHRTLLTLPQVFQHAPPEAKP
jgi:L-aspartate oxidase